MGQLMEMASWYTLSANEVLTGIAIDPVSFFSASMVDTEGPYIRSIISELHHELKVIMYGHFKIDRVIQ